MDLLPLNNTFLFQFFSDTSQGRFIEKNKGSIILTNQDISTQGKYARWGKVVTVGHEVTSFKEGDIVLIESLQWTMQFKHGNSTYWKSDESKVLAIGKDESVTFTYG